MFKDILNAVGKAARAMTGKPSAVVLGLIFYLGLVAAVYFFVVTREATVGQLVLTGLTALVALALFFALQSVGVRYTRSSEGFGALLRSAARDCWKLFAASLPVLLLGVGGLFAFALIEFLLTRNDPAAEYGFVYTRLIPGLRFLLLFFILPVVAVQVWIVASRETLSAALKGIGKSFARGFSLKSLITYLLIFLVVGAITYFLVFTRTPVSNPWMDIGLLSFRLVIAGLVIFLGWFLALGALTEATEKA
ncbi:MAG: hypothetical protein ABI882_02155 [Acidobacteriota bacterium]